MRVRVLMLLSAAIVMFLPAAASAQVFGIGPRLSFVHSGLGGDAPTPSTRFVGGTIRLRTSPRVVLEGALDYRGETNEDGTQRLRERPMQGSLLLFPVRKTFAPYMLGGLGLYPQSLDTIDKNTGRVLTTTTVKKTGWHLGLGAEVTLARHAAMFLDYRFRFVSFKNDNVDFEPGQEGIPGLGTFKLAHNGSMWTSGVAFYF